MNRPLKNMIPPPENVKTSLRILQNDLDYAIRKMMSVSVDQHHLKVVLGYVNNLVETLEKDLTTSKMS